MSASQIITTARNLLHRNPMFLGLMRSPDLTEIAIIDNSMTWYSPVSRTDGGLRFDLLWDIEIIPKLKRIGPGALVVSAFSDWDILRTELELYGRRLFSPRLPLFALDLFLDFPEFATIKATVNPLDKPIADAVAHARFVRACLQQIALQPIEVEALP